MAANRRTVAVGGFDRQGRSRLTGTGSVVILVLAVPLCSMGSPRPAMLASPAYVVLWVALAVLVVIGVVTPLLLVRRLVVDAASPRDATVGETLDLRVTVDGAAGDVAVRALDPVGPWCRARPGVAVDLPHLAEHRGVFGFVRVEVQVTRPLGLLAARRVVPIEMPAPVAVAPRPLEVDWRSSLAPVGGTVSSGSAHHSDGDLVRSVRPYAVGDQARLVHWPSSARRGEIVVRELEPPNPVGLAVLVDLTDTGADTETAASYAFGACLAVLQAGGVLLVATREVEGPVVAPVLSRIDAGRRLARAVPGAPAVVPEGWPVVEFGR